MNSQRSYNMKYLKHIKMVDGEKVIQSYQPEGSNSFIPHDPANSDYARMVSDPDTVIEEVDDT